MLTLLLQTKNGSYTWTFKERQKRTWKISETRHFLKTNSYHSPLEPDPTHKTWSSWFDFTDRRIQNFGEDKKHMTCMTQTREAIFSIYVDIRWPGIAQLVRPKPQGVHHSNLSTMQLLALLKESIHYVATPPTQTELILLRQSKSQKRFLIKQKKKHVRIKKVENPHTTDTSNVARKPKPRAFI